MGEKQPYQTLIFPYKEVLSEIKYAIFLRRDMNVWQGICGGGEGKETVIETAKREAYEEAKRLLKWDCDKTALWELNERVSKIFYKR